MPHRLMAGQRFLVPSVEVRILVGQLNDKAGLMMVPSKAGFIIDMGRRTLFSFIVIN